jgi:hypothetical protein
MEDRRFRTGISVVATVVTLVVVSAEGAEKIQYRLKFEKGQSYYVRVISDSNTVQEMTGQESVTEVTAGFGYHFDVKEVDEKGNAWVNCTFDWIKFRQKTPKFNVVYDSSKKPSRVPSGAQAAAVFLGESFSVKMTPQGHVEELKGLEKLRENMGKKLPGGFMKQQMLQSSEQHLADSIKELYLSPMAVYPNSPVGIGDSWSRTDSFKTQPFVSENKWTLKDRKAGIAIIEASSAIKSRPEPLGQDVAKMKFEMSGKRAGQIEMKESTGQIIRSEMTKDLSGQAQAGTMAIFMRTHTVTTFEMAERKK